MIIHPNAAGRRQILRSVGTQEALVRLAETVADEVRHDGSWDQHVEHTPGDVAIPVEVNSREEADEVRASVVLAHPSGLAAQAKHGSLTRGAAAAGLEVNG